MLCPLMKIQLAVTQCPAKNCIYRGADMSCSYSILTKEGVSVKDIAEVRQKKPYKIQIMASTAKQSVILGATLMKYADYVKESFPNLSKNNQTVNSRVDTAHLSNVLFIAFGLTAAQQRHFWDESRLTKWSKMKGLSLTVPEVRAVLLAASTS